MRTIGISIVVNIQNQKYHVTDHKIYPTHKDKYMLLQLIKVFYSV